MARTLVREVLDVGVAPLVGLKKSLMVVCLSPSLGEIDCKWSIVLLWFGLGLVLGSWQFALTKESARLGGLL